VRAEATSDAIADFITRSESSGLSADQWLHAVRGMAGDGLSHGSTQLIRGSCASSAKPWSRIVDLIVDACVLPATPDRDFCDERVTSSAKLRQRDMTSI